MWGDTARKQVKNAINLVKMAGKLTGKDRKEAERLGLRVDTAAETAEDFRALVLLAEKLNNIGAYPELMAACQAWDGRAEIDVVGMALEQARADVRALDAEKKMNREEWDMEQMRKAAENHDSTDSLFGGGSFSVAEAREHGGQLFGNPEQSRSFSIEEEIRGIRERAQADGTYMKAPNGEKTNLTEAQWVSVRTTNFKKWFGDWERAAQFKAAMGKIMSMKPVAAISGNEFQKDGTPLTEKVTKFWKERFGGAAISPELGEVKLDIEGVKSSIGHGIGSLKAAAFACVADVIRKGIVFDRQKNWKKRGYDTAVIAAPVTIKGAEYICEIVVTQRANKQGFYLHEVEIKKKLEDVFKTSTEGGTPQASRSILARRAEDIKREEEEISKVVDENGEPMVVYHGTQRDFGNVFRDPEEDRDWRGQYDMNYAEDTYWFADHAFTAQTYQSPQYLKPDRNYVQTAKRPRNKTPLAAEDVEYTFYKRTFDRRDWPVDTPVSAEEALKKDGTMKEGRGRASYYANMQLKPGRKTPQGYEGLNGKIMQFNTTGFHGKVPRTLEEALDWWNRGIAKDEMPLPQESRLYEVFLNVRNPLIIDEHGERFREMGRKAYRAKNTGHDGLIVKDVRDPGSYETQISNGKSIAVFKPGQIKSATENRGTYSSRNADITLSVMTYGQWARQALRRRPDELVAGKVLKRFDKWLKMFDTAVGSTNKTLGTGAARLGVIAGLMEATRSVLPPQYQFGRLNVLMSWAAVYAELAETGEVPKSGGVLKGPIFDKFINALEARRDMGMTEQELRDTLASLGAVKLEDALKKVARGCREQLDLFIKDRAREQIENLWKRAFPDKNEKGARKKGKMHAHNYRLAAEMLKAMNMTAAEVNSKLQAKQTELAAPNTTQERADELRTEMGILQTFGAWESLDAEAAEKALDAFRGFIGSGRTEWDMKEEERKARARRKTRRSMLFFDRLSVMPRHYRNKKCFT